MAVQLVADTLAHTDRMLMTRVCRMWHSVVDPELEHPRKMLHQVFTGHRNVSRCCIPRHLLHDPCFRESLGVVSLASSDPEVLRRYRDSALGVDEDRFESWVRYMLEKFLRSPFKRLLMQHDLMSRL